MGDSEYQENVKLVNSIYNNKVNTMRYEIIPRFCYKYSTVLLSTPSFCLHRNIPITAIAELRSLDVKCPAFPLVALEAPSEAQLLVEPLLHYYHRNA